MMHQAHKLGKLAAIKGCTHPAGLRVDTFAIWRLINFLFTLDTFSRGRNPPSCEGLDNLSIYRFIKLDRFDSYNSLLHRNQPWKNFHRGSLEWMNKESVGGATHDEGDQFCFHWGGPGAWFDQHIWLLTISDPSLAGQQPLDQGQGVVFSLVMDVIVVHWMQCLGIKQCPMPRHCIYS